jgi:photosystem II stability/assembly factor-like uncharacterized protein
MRYILLLTAVSVFSFSNSLGQKKTNAPKLITDSAKTPRQEGFPAGTFSGFRFRSIGPALVSGRIVDLAVNPNNHSEYFVAAANGGVWKTNNAGVTFTPVFDNEGSCSIGCVVMDPSNSNVVWVGSGENNNQRVVGYGDGVYKSEDGGKSWKNVGLKNSEHIGKIAIDPNNTDIVYVAAYGPLWSSGGDRGIYKTTDGGKTWKQVLSVSENTGFNEVMIDPRNTNIIYAAAHQRQRKVFTYVGGGPESAVYRSTDGGVTWNKIMKGLPVEGDLGRIGLAMSPLNPDYLFAIVEAADNKGGVFASTDRGSSWERRSNYSTSGNYYQEIFCDPKNINRLYSVDVYMQVSDDGGRTFRNLGEKSKHVDNHIIWVDPNDTKHMLVGCDGGLYETFDEAQNWNYKANLPVTQFYKVSLDNSVPFYYVYGGTQDNFSLGGPSRTRSENGINNGDWFITTGGDGFESQADYADPNIVYAESQYGGLVRFDRRTGENMNIKPVEAGDEAPYRWNWDAPLQISKHDHKRLYFGSNKVFRTDDQGNTWRAISGDLSRGIDRNKLTVMGKVWSVDAVAKNGSTDVFGQLTTIAESPVDENVLYAGTDDGLIHVTVDGGKSWTKIDNIAGVPERTYVNQIVASNKNRNTAYVTFNHHRYGDFRPYLYKTTDAGKTWTPIQNNLPVRGTVYTVAEDHVNPDLLFAGTEFGVYFSIDGGEKWTQLKGGLPTITIKDMEIQKRENDLVIATFGRGYYVLDDYSPLRSLKKEDLQKAAFISPIKTAWMYVESTPLGVRGKGFQGESFWTAPNPKPGSVFTYFLKDDIKTLKEKRQEAEKQKIKIGDPPFYPTIDSLRLEDAQPAPYLLFTVSDENGSVVRRLKAPAKKGINRITWDFRTDPTSPVSFTPFDESNVFASGPRGIMVLPGNYKVSLSKFEDGVYTQLVAPQPFKIEALNMVGMSDADKKALFDFGKKVSELQRAVTGTNAYRAELLNRLRFMKEAALQTSAVDQSIVKDIISLEQRLNQVGIKLNGDVTLTRREFEAPTSISNRIGNMMEGVITTTEAPTNIAKNSYTVSAQQFAPLLAETKAVGEEVKRIENLLEKSGAPYTPGRIPDWRMQ